MVVRLCQVGAEMLTGVVVTDLDRQLSAAVYHCHGISLDSGVSNAHPHQEREIYDAERAEP